MFFGFYAWFFFSSPSMRPTLGLVFFPLLIFQWALIGLGCRSLGGGFDHQIPVTCVLLYHFSPNSGCMAPPSSIPTSLPSFLQNGRCCFGVTLCLFCSWNTLDLFSPELEPSPWLQLPVAYSHTFPAYFRSIHFQQGPAHLRRYNLIL